MFSAFSLCAGDPRVSGEGGEDCVRPLLNCISLCLLHSILPEGRRGTLALSLAFSGSCCLLLTMIYGPLAVVSLGSWDLGAVGRLRLIFVFLCCPLHRPWRFWASWR